MTKKLKPLQLDPSPGSPPSKEAVDLFENFWKDLVCDSAGRLIRNAVIKELADYAILMDNTSEVFCEITGGRISKHNTRASTVIAVAEDVSQEIYDNELQTMEAEFNERLRAEKAIWEAERFQLLHEITELRRPPAPSDALAIPSVLPEVELSEDDIEIIELYPEIV